jgi:calcyphosin
MRQRGARGIIGLRRVFKIIDDSGNGQLELPEFFKALKDYRVQLNQDEAQILFGIFDINHDGTISYEEFLRIVIGEMNPQR